MNTLSSYIRALVLACIFAVPLVVLYVSSWSFFPYIVGKGLMFRILVEIALGGWLALVLLGAIPRPRLTPIRIAMIVFIGIVAIADFTGVAPFKSFWSNFERMEGLITLLHAFAYSIVAGSILNTHKLWERFWQFSLGVSVFVGLSGFAELADGVARIAGSTGNAIYLAVYALFHIFIAAILFTKTSNTAARIAYCLIGILNLAVIWLTGTRGTLLGLITGMAVFALGVAIFAKGREYKTLRKTLVGGFLVVSLLIAGLVVAKDSDFIQENNTLKRITELSMGVSETDRNTGALRIMVWETALKGVKERPILGWGQENFNYIFNKHYNPNMYWAEQWYDRTHNILLDWLVAAGVLGLMAYLAMYFVIFYEALRVRYFGTIETALLAGLLAAYGVHNLFVFDHLISYILFFSLAAWLHSADAIEQEEEKDEVYLDLLEPHTPLTYAVLGTILIGVFFTVHTLNYDAYKQNRTLLQALVVSRTPDATGYAQQLFLEASTYQSVGTQEVREQFLNKATQIIQNEAIDPEVRQNFGNTALAEMMKQHDTYADDTRFSYFIGLLYKTSGDLAKADEYLGKALASSPKKIAILMQYGHTAQLAGDYPKAREVYTRALAYAPQENTVTFVAQIQQLLASLPAEGASTTQ